MKWLVIFYIVAMILGFILFILLFVFFGLRLMKTLSKEKEDFKVDCIAKTKGKVIDVEKIKKKKTSTIEYRVNHKNYQIKEVYDGHIGKKVMLKYNPKDPCKAYIDF